MDNKYKAIKERIINLYPDREFIKPGLKGLQLHGATILPN